MKKVIVVLLVMVVMSVATVVRAENGSIWPFAADRSQSSRAAR